MLTELTRSFSAAELRLLRRRVAIPKAGSVPWLRDECRTLAWTVGIAFVLLAVGAFFRELTIASIAATLFAFSRLGSYRVRRGLGLHHLAFRQRLFEELESGTAYAITCHPTRIIEREEFEDEGAFWIFDGGEGRYLALCGQEYRDTPRFPSSHFEIIMGSRHRTLIGIRSRGPRASSSTVVSDEDIPWASFPKQGVTLFNAPAEAALPIILQALRAMDAT